MISRRQRALVMALRSRRSRPATGAFLVEGMRGAEEALDAGIGVRFAVVTAEVAGSPRGSALLARLPAHASDPVVVDARELEELADTETPQGILLVCEEPVPVLPDAPRSGTAGAAAGAPESGATPEPARGGVRHLVLDGVQDPGNAGTLVRAAFAFGLDAVVALEGTVDPWNPKVVRAAAGAAFRVPVVRMEWSGYHEWLRSRKLALFAADAGGKDVRTLEETSGRWALVLGNEGHGVRPELRECASRVVAIPMPGGAESLNAGVAGAILLYELTRSTSIA